MRNNDFILESKIYVAGTRGYSNYEIAVQNGFIGTEEEWLQYITDQEADIVWNNIKEEIAAGTINFELTEQYNAETESLILSVLPTEVEQ